MKKLGRREILDERQKNRLRMLLTETELPMSLIARRFGVSDKTIQHYNREWAIRRRS